MSEPTLPEITNMPETSSQSTAQRPHRKSSFRRSSTLVSIVLLLAAVGIGGVFYEQIIDAVKPTHSPELPTKHVTHSEDAQSLLVKVVTPTPEDSLPITVEAMAVVEPYYRADLRARASGVVKAVYGDLGDHVNSGDLLVEIDAPESQQDVAQKEALVIQSQNELELAKSRLKQAEAARDVASAAIKQRKADVQAAAATRDFKKKLLDRYEDLSKRGTVIGNVVEEQQRDFNASEAQVAAAEASVDRAIADYAESESRVDGAVADIKLVESQIEVARRALDRAKVVANFGKLIAPFDGVIVRRTIDPGSFVQNATSGASEPLISISRLDLVTVSARFTDEAAPYIAQGTPCSVQVDSLPEVTITGKVTRFSPSIFSNDRTINVEIDLFNGNDNEFRALQKMYAAKEGDAPATKGVNDPIPLRVFPANTTDAKKLLPGMTGKMSLAIGGFGKSFVVPSTCVYSRSGATYILVVDKGKTKQLPVRVQLNDGRNARVAIVHRTSTGKGDMETLAELSGKEQIIATRQLEIGDNVEVRTTQSESQVREG